MEDALLCQLIDDFAGLEGGVELYEWVGPEETLTEISVDLILQAVVFDPYKAAHI